MKVSAGKDSGRYTVKVDGVDVSHRCYGADDAEGVAHLYAVDGDGKFFIDRRTGDVARQHLHGSVVITPL